MEPRNGIDQGPTVSKVLEGYSRYSLMARILETLAGSETVAWWENAYAQNLGDLLSSYHDTYAPSDRTTEGRRRWQEESDSLIVLGAWESHVHGEAAGQNEFLLGKHVLHAEVGEACQHN